MRFLPVASLFMIIGGFSMLGISYVMVAAVIKGEASITLERGSSGTVAVTFKNNHWHPIEISNWRIAAASAYDGYYITDSISPTRISWIPAGGTTTVDVTVNVHPEAPLGELFITFDAYLHCDPTPHSCAVENWSWYYGLSAVTVYVEVVAPPPEEPRPTYYTLTTKVYPPGTGGISPTEGTHTYAAGTTVKVSAVEIPDSGYVFSYWSGDASGTAWYVYITMDRDKSVTANFEEKEELEKYSLTTSVYPEGAGTVDPSGTTTWYRGDRVTITAYPSGQYVFKNWSGDVCSDQNPITIEMDGNKQVQANFEVPVKITYTLTTEVRPSVSGTVSPSLGIYEEGEIIALTATANAGYVFNHWSGDVTGTDPSVSLVMDSDKHVIANFDYEVITYKLTSWVEPPNTGAVYPPWGRFSEGSTVTITAEPYDGFEFDYWSVDATGTDPTTTITMSRDMHVVANFKPKHGFAPTAKEATLFGGVGLIAAGFALLGFYLLRRRP